MKTAPFQIPLLLAAALALAPLCALRADESTSHIAFSDPSKPGTLKIRVWNGAVSIKGEDVKDISVKTESKAEEPTPRDDGLRVISASSSYRLAEKGNVVSLEYGADGWSGAPADFEVIVPRSTSIVVANSVRGDFECSDVSGDIDVRTMDGDVKLEGVSGGALVETMNGEIKVDVKSLAVAKPLSFTSMNGKVQIRVPADSKACVRFRTHHGVILTNFDDKALVTRTEISRHAHRKAPKADPATGPKASAEASPAESEAPRAESDGDWHEEVRDQIREAAQEAAMAAREAAEAVHEGLSEFRVEFSGAAMPAIPPLPPMTGGKVVAGNLNGGGVEIQASTLNGDIILKKVE